MNKKNGDSATAVRTRFAPSPSGYLHVGGARTALFSRAFARQKKGEFILRIEDTDAARSSTAHVDAIVAAMQWLKLDFDGEVVFQSARKKLHLSTVEKLLDEGRAYRCYCTRQELKDLREAQIKRGETPRYDNRWRECKQPPPKNAPFTVRLKTPLSGEVFFDDQVKGKMGIANKALDDLVLSRSDGAPTYNLANVADDIAMNISHIIRGDDHVMNTFRQLHIFAALQTPPPIFAHLPMILCAVQTDDGGEIKYERMSKRCAAVDVAAYRNDGFLAAAMTNYLARLSWSRGDIEFFDDDFFVENFSFDKVQKSPARFDMDKLLWLNREHLRKTPIKKIRQLAAEFSPGDSRASDEAISLALPRADTLRDLTLELKSFVAPPSPDEDLLKQFLSDDNKNAFVKLCESLTRLSPWTTAAIKKLIKESAAAANIKFPRLAMPLRIVLVGKTESADIAAVMSALGKDETLRRLAFDNKTLCPAVHVNAAPPPI